MRLARTRTGNKSHRVVQYRTGSLTGCGIDGARLVVQWEGKASEMTCTSPGCTDIHRAWDVT